MKIIKYILMLLLIVGVCSSEIQAFQTQSDYEREQKLKTETMIEMSFFIQGACYGSIFTAYMNDCCSLHLIAKIIAVGLLSHIAVAGSLEMRFPRNNFYEQGCL